MKPNQTFTFMIVIAPIILLTAKIAVFIGLCLIVVRWLFELNKTDY